MNNRFKQRNYVKQLERSRGEMDITRVFGSKRFIQNIIVYIPFLLKKFSASLVQVPLN